MSCYIRPHAIPSNSHPNFTPFNPLLSFLEDFATQFQPDSASSTPAHRQPRSSPSSSSSKKPEKPTPSYTPRFDIVEKDNAYELYGELPGVKVEDVSVEFTDEKNLTISGSSARFAIASTSAQTPAPEAAPTSETETTTSTANSKGKGKQAAVEDADDFEDLSSSRPATPDSSATAPDPETQSPDDLDAATVNATTTANTARQAMAPDHKFLLSERKYGIFSRTFQFPVPVEKEEVSARLRDGVLVVSVPKRVVRSQRVRVCVE